MNKKEISKKPGVYIFYDKNHKILYVGKAKNLKNRLNTYFRAGILENENTKKCSVQRLLDNKEKLLRQNAVEFETIITNSEREALILESNLIKKHKPRYNVMLKDNSEYIYLKYKFDKEKMYIPELSIIRKKTTVGTGENLSPVQRSLDNEKLYGPYTSKKSIVEIIKILSKTFGFECLKVSELNKKYIKDKKDKIILSPCFNYHIGRCNGICCGKIERSEYIETVKNAMLFFSGKTVEIRKKLVEKMNIKAGKKEYEKAQKIKEQILNLDKISENQDVREIKQSTKDIISFYKYNKSIFINIFNIRNGLLLGKRNLELKNLENENEKEEFLKIYYLSSVQRSLDKKDKPKEIVLENNIENKDIEKILNIKIRKYNNKNERNLIELGKQNSKIFIKSKEENKKILLELQKRLKLDKIPNRIECFDISNIQGKYSVGSMSVAIKGIIEKSEYRKFKIKEDYNDKPNDFLMLSEIIKRRLSNKNIKAWGLPDLIVLDGGKPQLNTILKLKKNKKYKNILNKINIVALAKKNELIYFYKNEKLEEVFGEKLFLIRQLRDEAHRFGIKYHRQRRDKSWKINK
ncbi:excinuclease ABC subunit UvrC [Patescibacteria group bacterium]|nr:excinuclease ABC subunit UvrC [Patescibacteria group bacterium]